MQQKGKNLYFGFVDLEKAFDRIPREVMMGNAQAGSRRMASIGIMSMYTGAKTVVISVVRTVYDNSNCFEVKVGMHQGSALSLGLYQIYFFPIRPEPDFAGFGMTNPAGAGFSN